MLYKSCAYIILVVQSVFSSIWRCWLLLCRSKPSPPFDRDQGQNEDERRLAPHLLSRREYRELGEETTRRELLELADLMRYARNIIEDEIPSETVECIEAFVRAPGQHQEWIINRCFERFLSRPRKPPGHTSLDQNRQCMYEALDRVNEHQPGLLRRLWGAFKNENLQNNDRKIIPMYQWPNS